MEKEFPCPKCERKLKSASGLIGHMRLQHSEQKVRTTPDDIGQRLENMEAIIATTINPGEAIKTEEEVKKALELLLPAIKRYGLAVCCFEKAYSYDPKTAEYRVVMNSQIQSFGLGSNKVAVVIASKGGE